MNNSQSREFFDLVKSIGECRSKQEEDRIIENEIVVLKAKFANANKASLIKELLVRAIYVEMLGHDAQFAYIHGVNLCHDKSLIGKRIGYLVCCLFLSPDSELMFLLINTIQKDLKSTNLLHVSFALIAVSKLVTAEMVPALTALITPLLAHSSEMIRRRAVIAFHRMVQLDDSVLVQSVVRKSLCDPDPGVMAVGLNPIWDLARVHPHTCKELVPSLVSILQQIIEHKLPRDFDYHRMPAPWIQIRLVSILGLLGENDAEVSNLIYQVLGETMRSADLGSNAGTAVVFEVIKTAAKIIPNDSLLEHASLIVSKFLAPEASHNFKYLGVTCLSHLAHVSPHYAADHQLRVVVCLDDGDESLRRQTLDLLFKMTNHANVTVVVERMLAQMRACDFAFKQSLGNRIFQLAEQFAPSNEWYLQTVNEVYATDPTDCFDLSVAYNLTRLVAQQDDEDNCNNSGDLRVVAANEYILLLEKFVMEDQLFFSPGFLQLVVWMIGEFATLTTLDGYASCDDTIDLLQDGTKKVENNTTMCFFVSALTKLSVASGSCSIVKFLDTMKNKSSCVQERCAEAKYILSLPRELQKAVLPFDASCEDIDLFSFTFLDEFTNQAKNNGAQEYKKHSVKLRVEATKTAITPLRFEAYSAPQKPATTQLTELDIPHTALQSPPVSQTTTPQLQVGTNKWGPPKVAIQTVAASYAISAPKSTHVSQPVTSPPRENLEQQRMAAALFSGIPGNKVESRWGSKKEKKEPTKDDLLDFDTTPAIQAKSVHPRKSSQNSDLLG